MPTSEELKHLFAEFPPSAISWRAQTVTQNGDKALALAYIDARDVMDRLDEICGAADWQDRYESHGSRTICYLSIKVDGDWITKADGAGDTQVEAEKGAISDAFKRAAVKWGIGRYLYAIKSPWVPCESYAGRDGKKKWKRWTADPWEYVKGAQPPRSAMSLKRSDKNGDDAWDRLTKDLANEMLDCKTLVRFDEIKRDYQKRAGKERWPIEWDQLLAGIFREYEQKLRGDDFPGDLSQHPLAAG